MFKPYLTALFLAIILRVAFDQVHEKILSILPNRDGISAFLSVLTLVIFIVLPVSLISILIFDDAHNLYSKVLTGDINSSFLKELTEPLESLIQDFIPDFSLDPLIYMREGLNFFLGNIGSVFSKATSLLFNLFIMLLALFYLFRDGKKLKKYIIFLSPLQNNYDESILKKLHNAVSGVVKGSLFIALIQGILSAIGFFIFGVPNAVLWGAVAALSALVPTFGTVLVVVPAIVFLFWSGAVASAIGLAIWGAIAVGLIDNILAPYFLTRNLNVHPFLILISVLGGFLFFGPVGFLAGPVLITLITSLLEMYPQMVSGEGEISKDV